MKMTEKFSKTVEKNVGKRGNYSLQAISPFFILFYKDMYCRHVKTTVALDSATLSTFCDLSNGIFNQVCRIFCSEHAPSTLRSKVVWSGGVMSSTWREPKQYFIAKNARNGLWQWMSLYATHVSLEQVDSILYIV